MHIEFDRAAMLDAIESIRKLVSPNEYTLGTNVSINAGVGSEKQNFLVVNHSGSTIRQRFFQVNVVSPGSTTIPFDSFRDLLREQIGTGVVLEAKPDEWVGIRDDSGDIVEFAPDLTPSLSYPTFKNCPKAIEVFGSDLASAVERTIFAVGYETSRFALDGVSLKIRKESLVFAATDGVRLAEQTIPLPKPTEITGSILLKPEMLKCLLEWRFAETIHIRYEVSSESHDIEFFTSHAKVHSCRSIGRFPDYEDVFGAEKKVLTDVLVGDLKRSLAKAMVAANLNAPYVSFLFEADRLTLACRRRLAKASSSLPIAKIETPVAIQLDGQFLLEMLGSLDPTMSLRIELIDSNSRIVLKTKDGYRHVLMPVIDDPKPRVLNKAEEN